MGLSTGKREFLVGILGELPVSTLEKELRMRSCELEASVAWKEQRPHPSDAFIAQLRRKPNPPVNKAAKRFGEATDAVTPHIREFLEGRVARG